MINRYGSSKKRIRIRPKNPDPTPFNNNWHDLLERVTKTFIKNRSSVTLPRSWSSVTLPGSGSSVTLPGSGSSVTLPGSGSSVTLSGLGSSVTLSESGSSVTLPVSGSSATLARIRYIRKDNSREHARLLAHVFVKQNAYITRLKMYLLCIL